MLVGVLLIAGCADAESNETATEGSEPETTTAAESEDALASASAISGTAEAAASKASQRNATEVESPTTEDSDTTPTSTPPGASATPTIEPTATSTATPEPPPTETPIPPTETPVPPTATPAPPTPTPTPEAFSFGEGTQIIGEDIPPGTYRSSGPEGGFFGSCYWERLAGFSGQLEDIIANEFADYRQVVTIKEGDAGFNSEGCGQWSEDLGPITPDPGAPFGDGTWIVNVDIAPGTWRSETPSGGGCYWERQSGFGGELEDIIANEFTDTEQIVTIAPSDAGFTTSDCGTWTLVGS